jgi:cbb3-type cytochrome oxidase cytochrome c subunit
MRKIRADRHVGLLLAGVMVLAFVAIGATIALPATDASIRSNDPHELTAEQLRGMEIYRAEGCGYCHTQYVRTTRGDAVLGKPLSARSYDGSSPAMLGIERVGPDLTHVAGLSADLISDHGDAMSLSYLSRSDLEALAAYLLVGR